jgi:hypothetical protein
VYAFFDEQPDDFRGTLLLPPLHWFAGNGVTPAVALPVEAA